MRRLASGTATDPGGPRRAVPGAGAGRIPTDPDR